MRIIAFEDRGSRALGVMRDHANFIPLAEADPSLPSSLIEVLEIEDGLDRVRQAIAGYPNSRALAEVRLIPFLEKPNALWALALNFKTHIAETGLQTSRDFPHMFLRIPSSYVGANQPLLSPAPTVARAYDYEGELGVVIGRPGRHIRVERALAHVAGYTCVNEGSVREYQIHNRQFGLGKNFEASGSYGPWLMTADEFGDPSLQWVSTRVNGIRRQHAPLNDMLFDVAQVVSYLSAGYELRPGDMIAMGTPGALKPAATDAEGLDLSSQYGPFKIPGLVHMKPGDLVEVEISGLGTLANPVAADDTGNYQVA